MFASFYVLVRVCISLQFGMKFQCFTNPFLPWSPSATTVVPASVSLGVRPQGPQDPTINASVSSAFTGSGALLWLQR